MSATTARAQQATGVLSAPGAAVLWGANLALTRLGVMDADGLAPADLALLRFLLPAIVLAPCLRGIVLPRPAILAALLAGGVPFVLLAAAGLRTADAASAGTLLPGSFPLCVAVLGMLLGTERIDAQRGMGLLLITASVVAVAAPGMGRDGVNGGHLLLIAAALASAGQAIALRRSGLAPLQATGLVATGSVLAFLPAYLLACQPRLREVGTGTLALHALIQGGLAGFAGPLLFTIAVRHLGAASASAFGGLTPSLASAFGMVLLGEFPSHATSLAGLVAGAGVVLAALAPIPGYAAASRARA